MTLSGSPLSGETPDRQLHIEQMNAGYWWMDIGGVTVHVHANRDGKPQQVTVHGPNNYAEAVPGCTYDLTGSEVS